MIVKATQAPTWKADLLASLVVFLIALPLCLGIAVASGAPPIAGLLSGIVGGLVVASLGGSTLQISGPANSLIVLILLVTQEHGLGVLGAVVLAAGALQLLAAGLRLGQVFRAIPPATIHGLMTGFAVIIFASQFHVMLDDPVCGSPLQNLVLIPRAMWDAITVRDGSHQAAAVGVLTIALLLLWKRVAPRRLSFLPASLVAVGVATAAAAALSLPVTRVVLPDNILGAVRLVDLADLRRLLEWDILEIALIMGFLASTESLLSATAVDLLHQGPRTNYDRELAAQGLGNMICGLIGGVPLTGAIIRSAANVGAGARTRLSGVLHGVWLLAVVALLPGLLMHVPTASLAAVLVVAVFKLISLDALRAMARQDKRELAIYAVTAGTIVFWGVLPGVLLGLGLAIVKLLHTLGHLSVQVQEHPESGQTDLYLGGTATFLSLPKLAMALEEIPAGTELHVHFDDLMLIDHACLDLIMSWERRHESTGGRLVLDWTSLRARFGNRKLSKHPAAATAGKPRRFFRAGWKIVRELRS